MKWTNAIGCFFLPVWRWCFGFRCCSPLTLERETCPVISGVSEPSRGWKETPCLPRCLPGTLATCPTCPTCIQWRGALASLDFDERCDRKGAKLQLRVTRNSSEWWGIWSYPCSHNPWVQWTNSPQMITHDLWEEGYLNPRFLSSAPSYPYRFFGLWYALMGSLGVAPPYLTFFQGGLLHPWKLTAVPWKSMVGSDVFPTKIVPF